MRQGAKVHNTMSRARGALLLGGILVAVLVGFIAWIYLRQAASGLPAEVEYIEVGPTEHVGGNIDYDQDLGTPPAGDRTTPNGKTVASTKSPSATRTPCTPWSMGRSGSPINPTSPRTS
jgi:hypothetical protein